MEGSNPLLPQQTASATFGGSANALARLGRPLPGPFAHFASPIAPYTMPSFVSNLQQQTAPNTQMFSDQSSLHSTLASMAAYSFDNFLSANFANNFANFLMMSPNQQNAAAAAAALSVAPPLLGAFGPTAAAGATSSTAATNQSNHHHSPSPNSASSSPNYFRRDVLIGDTAVAATSNHHNQPPHPHSNHVMTSKINHSLAASANTTNSKLSNSNNSRKGMH